MGESMSNSHRPPRPVTGIALPYRKAWPIKISSLRSALSVRDKIINERPCSTREK
jgi:hypothetical protein